MSVSQGPPTVVSNRPSRSSAVRRTTTIGSRTNDELRSSRRSASPGSRYRSRPKRCDRLRTPCWSTISAPNTSTASPAGAAPIASIMAAPAPGSIRSSSSSCWTHSPPASSTERFMFRVSSSAGRFQTYRNPPGHPASSRRTTRPLASPSEPSDTVTSTWEATGAIASRTEPSAPSSSSARLRVGIVIDSKGRATRQHHLPHIEAFRIPGRRVRLQPTQPHHRPKCVCAEPRAVELAREVREQQLDLPRGGGLVQGDEQHGSAEVALVLGDLVLEDQVVAEGVPGQLRDQAVVLVRVVAARGQDQVRREAALELLEGLLDRGALPGEEAVPEGPHLDLAVVAAAEERLRAVHRLLGALALAAQHQPADLQRRELRDQPEEGAAAADLDVVGMRAEHQQPPDSASHRAEDHRKHPGVPTRTGRRPVRPARRAATPPTAAAGRWRAAPASGGRRACPSGPRSRRGDRSSACSP